MKYDSTASFEYMKSKMKGKSAEEIKDIFEHYTKHPITDDEAQAIYNGLNTPREHIENDFWYEPEATMGFILRKSKYRANVKNEKIEKPALLRRGNVGFTGTNHTAEDQLVVMYGGKGRYFRLTGMKSRLDNTDLYYVMTRYLGIKHKNPKMTEEEARRYITALTPAEWRRHLELHIA
jgi:alkaline phosphatase